jgi:AraC-like DNA-binding protein
MALYLGPMEDASEHSHHAVQLAIGLSGEFDLWIRGMNRKCRTVVIASDQPHRFAGRDGLHAIILIEQEYKFAQTITDKHCNNRGSAEFDPALVSKEIETLRNLLDRPPDCQRFKEVCDAILKCLSGDGMGSHLRDSRIDNAITLMRQLPDHKAPIHVVAEEVGLSESRLIHLFKEQVGIPIRRYLLWLRLVAAIEQALEGISLTTAAHNAGFADSAHLSRTFKQMFGITPSYLLKNSRFLQVISCLQ